MVTVRLSMTHEMVSENRMELKCMKCSNTIQHNNSHGNPIAGRTEKTNLFFAPAQERKKA